MSRAEGFGGQCYEIGTYYFLFNENVSSGVNVFAICEV